MGAYMGYVKEAQINGNESADISASVTSSGAGCSAPSSIHVSAVALSGVEQTGNPYSTTGTVVGNSGVTTATYTSFNVLTDEMALIYTGKDDINTSAMSAVAGYTTTNVNAVNGLNSHLECHFQFTNKCSFSLV